MIAGARRQEHDEIAHRVAHTATVTGRSRSELEPEPPLTHTGGMTRFVSPLLRWSALSILTAATAAAAATPQTVIVHAGDFDRRETPVALQLPAALAGPHSLAGPAGERVPLQVDPTGRAIFIEPQLARGASKTYRIEIAPPGAPEVQLEKQGATLHAAYAGAPIFSYQMEPGEVPAGVAEIFRHGAHLHPVFSPSGKVVTGNHPPDHRWHRGIWFAWTHTEFAGRAPDFWNMGKDNATLSGEVRFDRLERSWSGPVQGGFASRHRLIDHTGGGEKDALAETWEVAVYRPLAGATPAFVFDLISTQTCASAAAVKLPKYHYGGLGVRGNAQWDPAEKVTMLTSNGDDRKAGDGSKGKWVHLGGDVDGAPTGLAVLIHPENFRFPQPLRLNPKNPQLCVAPSQDGDWEIAPGQPYVSRYRFVVADGKPDAAELNRLWTDYAQPPQVEIR